MDSSSTFKDNVRFWLCALVLSCLVVSFPGDVPFICDEALLLSNAYEANQNHQLAKQGLQGTAGVRYGPVATWFYQGCLLVTRNPIAISLFKNILTFSVVLFALLQISKILKYSRYPVLLIFVSPYLYLYSRMLWDNCFTIPLSALLFMGFLKFTKKPNGYVYCFCLTISILLISIHLMSVIVIIPFLAAIAMFGRKWFIHNRLLTISGILAVGMLCLPHSLSIIHNYELKELYKNPIWENFALSVTGVKYFSFWGWGDYFLPEIYASKFPIPNLVLMMLISITCCSFVFFAIGLIDSIKSLHYKTTHSEPTSEADKLAVLCLLAIVFNSLFFVIARHQHHPHYFGSIWFAYFYFLWRCADSLIKKKRMRFVVLIYSVSMLVLLSATILFIHKNGGNRGFHFGPTLGNQVQIMKKIVAYSPQSHVVSNTNNYLNFPHAYDILRTLCSSDIENGTTSRPVKYIIVDYKKSADENSGWLDLIVEDEPFYIFLKESHTELGK